MTSGEGSGAPLWWLAAYLQLTVVSVLAGATLLRSEAVARRTLFIAQSGLFLSSVVFVLALIAPGREGSTVSFAPGFFFIPVIAIGPSTPPLFRRLVGSLLIFSGLLAAVMLALNQVSRG